MNYQELKQFYINNFGLGFITEGNGRSSFENKVILLSLICYVTYKSKSKYPKITHYEIIKKLGKNLNLPKDFMQGLSIMCEDFSYNCSDFPTFGLKGQEIIKEVVNILKSYLPF